MVEFLMEREAGALEDREIRQHCSEGTDWRRKERRYIWGELHEHADGKRCCEGSTKEETCKEYGYVPMSIERFYISTACINSLWFFSHVFLKAA